MFLVILNVVKPLFDILYDMQDLENPLLASRNNYSLSLE
jgi:hypothetical protein